MSDSNPNSQGPVKVWTDGSSNRQDKDGGLAFVSTFGARRLERWIGYKPSTTNNQMELGAILLALNTLTPSIFPLIIYSDSEYAINCVTRWHSKWSRQRWRKGDGSEVKNRELIEAIINRLGEFRQSSSVTFEHVRGHTGVTENERADFLASAARRQFLSNHKGAPLLGVSGLPALYQPDVMPVNDFNKRGGAKTTARKRGRRFGQ